MAAEYRPHLQARECRRVHHSVKLKELLKDLATQAEWSTVGEGAQQQTPNAADARNSFVVHIR